MQTTWHLCLPGNVRSLNGINFWFKVTRLKHSNGYLSL